MTDKKLITEWDTAVINRHTKIPKIYMTLTSGLAESGFHDKTFGEIVA